MYAEHLQTPHPNKRGVESAEPEKLFDVLEPDFVRAQLDGIAQSYPHALDVARVYAADAISRNVFKALWFPERDAVKGRDDFQEMGIVDPIAPDAMYETQAANCFGFTIALSESLERSGIPHYVGYSANHAFVVLPEETEEGERLWYIDALYPELNHDMTDAYIRESEDNIDTIIAEHSRADFRIEINEFLTGAGQEHMQWVTHKNWPAVRPSDVAKIHRGSKDERLIQRFYSERMVASVFVAEDGRQILEQYAYFRQNISLGNHEQAYENLINMDGLNPEIDVRSEQHGLIKQLVAYLAENNDIERALVAINSYFSAFSASNHPNVDIMKADCLRLTSKKTREEYLAESAITLYKRAQSKQVIKNVGGRIAAAQALIDNKPVNNR